MVQELIERLDCEVVKESSFFPKDEKKREDDPSIPLQTRAAAILEKINNAELPKGPFDLNPGVRINNVRKFVEAHQHILEHVSPDRIVFEAALDRLQGFLKELHN
jgi:hypothetical protein